MSNKIIYKKPEELHLMAKAGDILARCLDMLGENCKAGVTTEKLDQLAETFIRDHKGVPTFLHYQGYPASACISINEEVVHGIPCRRVIREGDIVSVDCGVTLNGWVSDSARTFIVGDVPDNVRKLVDVTKECLFLGISKALVDNKLSDVSRAVQEHAEKNGFSVVRDLVGHGVGRNMHEPPAVPNYVYDYKDLVLKEGLVIAIEPMINLGTYKVKPLADGWTYVTSDLKPSAHWEHTIAVTKKGPVILTKCLD